MKRSKTIFLKYIKPITFSIAITALFLLVDYAEKYPFYLTAPFDNSYNIVQKLGAINWWPSVVVGIYVFMVWMLYINLKNVKAVFQEFIVPLSIVVFTLITGTIGFLQINDFNFGDAFFAAANLLTLNTSVLKPFLGDNSSKVNFWIENARLMGGIFLAYAFILALSLATGKENTSRIRFRWFRLFNKIKGFFRFEPRPFYVVIGDGEKAISLALDLEKNAKRVAFLHQGFEEYTENIISEKKIWYLKGNASSKTGLEKTYFQQADKVYVLNDSDEENFRTALEMREVESQLNPKNEGSWYVHLSDPKEKSLLIKLMDKRFIQIFDINQNIARKVLLDYPFFEFSDTVRHTQTVIVGISTLAEAMILKCLQLGHFLKGQSYCIKVYYQKNEQSKVDSFVEKHPELFLESEFFKSDDDRARIQQYTFFDENRCEKIVSFECLPSSIGALRSPTFSIYSLFRKDYFTNVYVCLENGFDSSSFIGSILPRITWLYNKDVINVQLFCHYNFPDLSEQNTLEKILNAFFEAKVFHKQPPIYCFGNFMEVCTSNAIENYQADFVAQQIALLYGKGGGYSLAEAKKTLLNWNTDNLFEIWKQESEMDRESCRNAADHALIKFKLLNKNIDNLSSENETLLSFWVEDELEIIGEVEHRRWCAEKLIDGWIPIKNVIWKGSEKKQYKEQRFQKDLVPFQDFLDESLQKAQETGEKHVGEEEKDYTQMIGLPFFFRELKKKYP